MKASLCYHNRQGWFTPVWQGALGRIENVRKLIDRASRKIQRWSIRLADNAFDDVLGQIEPLVVWNRNAAGLAGMLEVRVRAGLFVNKKAALLQSANHHTRLQAGEFWRHPGLDRDF
jgi:hypothetical protein